MCTNGALTEESGNRFLDACYMLSSARAMEQFLRMNKSFGLTQSAMRQAAMRAAEWLADGGYDSSLQEAADDASAPPLHRLIASETLAGRSSPSGTALIERLAHDSTVSQDVRCLAW